MFRSQDIEIFVFLWNLQISKFVTSSQVLLHNASYTYAYFFWILSPIKMKFGQILVCCMANISNMFWLNAGDWKLVPGSFMILLKWQYSKIWPFLMVELSFIHLFKKIKHWNLAIFGYWVIGAGCYIKKDLESSPLKISVLAISINWPSSVTSSFLVQKI